MKDHKGYEKLDAVAECEDQYKEKQRRLNRVLGRGDYGYYGSESGEVIEGGFIHRNNVEEQI